MNYKKLAYIIDDEQHAIESLQQLIHQHCPQLEVKGTYSNSKDGLIALKKSSPDLLFLDVEMPWMNGFEILDILGKVEFDVIFTTAHDKYAVEAFRISATDYLLKPIDAPRLIAAVERAFNRPNTLRNESLKQLRHNISTSSIFHRIGIPTKNSIDYVLVEDILYCEADSNYAYIYLRNNNKIIMSKPLKDLEKRLKSYNFCRIHQSHLINLNHLKQYIRGHSGYVIMDNNIHLNVSRSRKEELMRKLNKE